MSDIAKGLSPKEARGLSDHSSKRPFKPARQIVSADVGRCGQVMHEGFREPCCADGGAQPVQDASILAGQRTPCLRRPLENCRSGKRSAPRNRATHDPWVTAVLREQPENNTSTLMRRPVHASRYSRHD